MAWYKSFLICLAILSEASWKMRPLKKVLIEEPTTIMARIKPYILTWSHDLLSVVDYVARPITLEVK